MNPDDLYRYSRSTDLDVTTANVLRDAAVEISLLKSDVKRLQGLLDAAWKREEDWKKLYDAHFLTGQKAKGEKQ